MIRIAILDDYQNVSLKMADWSPLAGRAGITVFNDHLSNFEEIVERLLPLARKAVCAVGMKVTWYLGSPCLATSRALRYGFGVVFCILSKKKRFFDGASIDSPSSRITFTANGQSDQCRDDQ